MNRILRYLLLLALLFVPSMLPAQIDSYDDVMMIVNTRSTASVEIGSFFAARRNIPESHICRIAVDTSETIDSARFVALKWEIQSWMRQRNLVDSINYIVTTKGCPLRVAASWDNAAAGVFGSQSSFEDCLVLINGIDSVQMLKVKTNSSFPTSRYFGSRARFRRNPVSLPMYLVTRLDAYTVEQVRSYILRAEQPAIVGEGLWVIDLDPGKEGGTYQVFNDYMRAAADLLVRRGLDVELDTDTTYLHQKEGVIGYASWGSNDGHSGGGVPAVPKNTWLNGSIAETAVSTSGRSFMAGTGYGQSLMADWIAEGACGVKGYTDEPYLFSIAHPDILFERYADGSNMAESFYAASQIIGWRQVVIGDPKMKLAVVLAFLKPSQSLGSIDRYSLQSDTVYIRNISSSTVEAAGIRFSGPDSLDFTAHPLAGAFPVTIGGGDSLAVVVTFRPTTYGSERATMTLLHGRTGDSATGIVSMTLTGVGLKPRLDAPAAVTFGRIEPAVTRTVLLRNASPSDTITISRIYLSGLDTTKFVLTPPPSLPVILSPGESSELTVVFTSEGVSEGTVVRLNIVSNAVVGTVRVDLVATNASSVTAAPDVRRSGAIVSISPNPIAGSGQITYDAPRNGADLILELFDMFGRRVAVLAEGPHLPGRHGATLDAASLPSGAYQCRLSIRGSKEAAPVSTQTVIIAR